MKYISPLKLIKIIKPFSIALIAVAFFGLTTLQSVGQTTVPYTANGTWVCPAGVTSATVQCWGAGGGGVTTPATNNYGGGGGGGGAYASSVVTVTPGTSYAIVVGTGLAATNGGNSTFNTTTVVAVGGTAGSNNSGGAGGAAASCTGTTKYSGGNGGTGTTGTTSGGGGGGAGSTGAGGNASAATAGTGTANNGGTGGAGGIVAPGNPGNNYGGGGAGAYGKSKTGGDGANGYVTITYTCPTFSLTATSGSSPVSGGSTSTVTLTSSAAGLPVGTYTVTYNLSAPNAATGSTATMTVSTAGTGTFTTSALATAGSTTVTVTNLASGACSNAISANNTSVITVTAPVTYCTPAPTSVDGTGITNVTCGTINNTTGAEAGNYGNYSAQSASFMQGATVTVNIRFSTGYTYDTKIWVDWNSDGDFADAGEDVYTGTSTSANPTTLVATFVIPGATAVGNYRMRIGGADSGPPTSCYTGSYATFEDYTLSVTLLPACSGTPTAGTATAGTSSFSCSGSTTITLTGYTAASGISYQWQSSPAGAGTWSNIAGETSTTYTTATLTASTDYRCVVTCSNGGASANSSTATVTINANVPGSASASSTSICSGSSTTISLTGATASGSTRQWQSSTDNATWTNISGATGATYSASPTVATYYRCVITCTAAGTSLNSASVQVTINAPTACYCSSTATSTSDMDITKITFGTINNTSATVSLTGTQGTATGTAGMYSNWRASAVPVPSVQQGSSNAFSVIIGGTAYGHRVDVYIDFNQDGDLVDAGESFAIFAYANPALPNTTNSSITIPLTATLGTTLMRVVCVESSSTSACGSYTWGETEDYNITITAAPACSGTPTAGTAAAGTASFSCSGSTTLTLTGYSIASGLTYQWQSSPAGAGTWSNIAGATSTTYTTATITSSTDYRCVVTCSNGGASANSSTATVSITTNVAGSASASSTSVCSGSSTTISLTGATYANSTRQWQSSIDNATWNNIPGATGATYSASPTTATYYRCVITCTAAGTTVSSASVQVTMNVPTDCYCNSIPSGTGDEEIYSVTVNGATRSYNCTTVAPGPGSVLNRYSNFTTLGALTSIQQGATIAFSISEDECDGSTYYSNGCAVWIDYNQDGDFTDAGEQIYVEGATLISPRTITGSFVVPITATTGNTRMRIIVSEGNSGSALLPCMTYSYGETEDHLINITAAPACAGAPTAGTAATDLTNFCNSGSPNLSLTGYTVAIGIIFQWQTSADNITWSIIPTATSTTYSSPSISQTTYFRCEVRCGASVSYSNVLTITKTAEDILTTNSPVNIACNATANLTATASGSASVKWYAAATGGSVLSTGTSYTTPALSANATYYCVANSGGTTESGGKPSKSNTYGSLTNGNGIVFDANQAFTLNSVTIYPKKSGNVTIAYQNSAGVQQAITGSVAVNGGNSGNAVVVPLGWAIPIGTGYRLVLVANSGITDLIYDYSTNYNYNSPSNALSVTDGWYNGGYTTSTNYYFYNLNISIPCESTPRTAVNVVINSGITAPVCSATPSPSTGATGICPVATTVSWAASSTACRAATSYLLYFGTDAAATNIINGTNIGNVLSYNLGTLAGSTVYYWKIVPVNSAGNATGCSVWSFTTVGNPGSVCPGLLGTGVTSVASLPYASGAGTTAGAGNDLTSANVVTCGSSSYLTGEDQVFVFTPTTSGSITIQLSSTGSYTGLMLYDGCPLSAGACGAPAGNCIASATSYTGDKTISLCIAAGITYYLVLDSYASPANNAYSNLTISAPSGTLTPANDLPCDATSMTLGVLSNGDNSCAGSASEPAKPSCWTSGNLNTIWYSVVAPASGQLSVRTITSGLTDTQIGLYSGSCSSLTFVTGGCNDNVSGCGSTSASQITMTGLTSGNTYYIRVDGAYDLMGTFSIMAIDPATSSFPATPGQDCSSAFPTCNSVLTTSDPGYANTGSTCDFSSANNCMGSGERSSVWYTIQIQNNGTLNFDIIPNDYSGGSAGDETDYDFIIWKTAGTGATSCSGITANAATGLVGCNYSYIGVTGVAAGGNAPAGFGSGFDGAYESSIPVLAGEQYTICVSNFSQSTSGFTIDYTTTSSSAINYTPSPAILNWTGSSSTAWASTGNWGACNIPTCTVSAVIGALVPRMPTISTNQSVNNLTINLGATLTIGPGVTLTVCGNFVNNGSLIMDPTATLFFNNTSTHQLSGNLTGSNAIGNILITQTAGSVNLTNALDINGNFTTSNATSVFITNGNYIKLAGNFVNAAGNTTYTTTGTLGTLEFNGTAAQTYNQGSSQLDLNFVKMNNTGTGLTLQTDMNIKATTGTLNLTLGKITTAAFKVVVSNSTTTSVSTGNTSSYVNGYLRRYINNSTGSFDFPVGTSTAYERANVNFTTAPTITYLTADFQTYATVPAALGSTECSVTYNFSALDNGFWNIDANTANNNTGVYNMTLYNTNYTNPGTAWTVMSRHNGSATWALVNGDGSTGTCVTGAVTAVVRNDMKGFSKFGTAQVGTALPITLISFTGKNIGAGRNMLNWQTATEVNNDYFTLERSENGYDYETLSVIDGAGNSFALLDYSYTDKKPERINYYRLKQTDFDGKYTYSNVVTINNITNENFAFVDLNPNPAKEEVNIVVVLPHSGNVKIEMLDLQGRLLKAINYKGKEGEQKIPVEIADFAQGVYLTKVSFEDRPFQAKRLVKQ